MPAYEHLCERCGIVFQERREMARAARKARCPRCRRACDKLAVPSNVAVRTFTPYAARSLGVPPHVMRHAETDVDGNHWLPRPDGSRVRLNPPGFKLDGNGDVLINSSGDRNRYLREAGPAPLVDLRDAPNELPPTIDDHPNMKRALRRVKKGEEALRKRGLNPGWQPMPAEAKP